MAWLFLVAYTCSGVAGLIYEVSWTRLLTLHLGHTTAAASTVVAAFLGGLAAGAFGGGTLASRRSRAAALRTYVGLELAVIVFALLLPWELRGTTPLLSWAYADGAGGVAFPLLRLASCLAMVFVPAMALGATFPMAIRWFASESERPAMLSGALYALNTAGAAVGAVLAGFALVPAIGISGSTMVAVSGSGVAALAAWMVLRREGPALEPAPRAVPVRAPSRGRDTTVDRRWLAAGVLGLSGFAALVHEIAWTRILALVFGPTTYAFAAVLAGVIAGVALGSAAGAWLVGRVRHPSAWLALALACGAVATSYTYSLAGQRIPSLVAREMATSDDPLTQVLRQGLWLTVALVVPTALCLGAAFPLGLSLAGEAAERLEARFGTVYAVNTLGSVTGSLAAGFLLIPRFGLQHTLQVASGCLIAAALVVVIRGGLSRTARAAGVLASGAAVVVLVTGPPWDRELLASGPYMYAPFVPPDLDLETMLRAGKLLYYREGAAATVSVKQLTGTTTLAVDGKVDASNRGDMLTQKLVAHLPLLVHDNPREVAVIGLGSGVTAGAVLRHPVERADVIEISPEVVEASHFFDRENHGALADPRTNLIVGDGRSHLLLSRKQYDVIVSEPSNPWIAGVAALFTREYFEGVRARLAPGGILCQWANAYDINDTDLRSIVATFLSIFPHGTLWLVGADDVLMMASDGPLDARLEAMRSHWARPGVADDLAEVAVRGPFSLWSLYVGGPAQLSRYAAGAPLLTDDTMRLEFSAPHEVHHHQRAGENVAILTALLGADEGPPVIREARRAAGAAEWRNRGLMMAKSDVHARAYDDFMRALQLDVTDAGALEGFTRTAVLTGRAPDALVALQELAPRRAATVRSAGTVRNPQTVRSAGTVRSPQTVRSAGTVWSPQTVRSAGTSVPATSVPATTASPNPHVLIAISKLQAAAGLTDQAVASAHEASRLAPSGQTFALEQMAMVLADTGNTVRLDEVVAALQQEAPESAPTLYYAAVAQFLHGNAEPAARLAERATAADPLLAPVYDLAGAAYTKLGRTEDARRAFERSLTFDAHDSTAYTNLGLLALAAGDRAAARDCFAEALWLEPTSATAREGLARTR
ncbi:MAG TPA: fused MFS/spermidine synthase [Vicinamibacterales bacterium]|nr:fused MFS/spermidine synthase [Vicinamibacterales bacterium]